MRSSSGYGGRDLWPVVGFESGAVESHCSVEQCFDELALGLVVCTGDSKVG
jgi:hypothetical protein